MMVPEQIFRHPAGTPSLLQHGVIFRPIKRNQKLMKKVNKQCLLDTPRTVRVSEKTWQAIVQTRRP